MQNKPNNNSAAGLFDDLTRMAGGAATALLETRHEVERMITAQCEKITQKMDLVSREEFEVVRDMAQKSRTENEALRARLETLEAKTKKGQLA